ncbi:hypothetical protein OSH23_24595 [Mycobacterium ulcerans]|uniref:Uncharacterized protein n=1 Tax=Mycobacterium ulcerans str. Harvey TaxID=1299332 RepID=A0ABP3ACR2_MYCUL|nr:hypothetical protein [Mycobacterium ulcerans]EUA88431.1 hypothetical protein I551_4955 [Mycobacterium ulcerans str. Harvey]GAQ36550.1 hypothetical protein MPS_3200 [Mycobacterium pseudoshottsii JCM 15466]MEB4005881.1 hypothetical protein [Mycobacterium ulcerans]MEB4090676.1 hypothetical protein [Mycobacterium ulcerans]MEB4111347.1 hypothetical protein [Mycobacterium ulcerans]
MIRIRIRCGLGQLAGVSLTDDQLGCNHPAQGGQQVFAIPLL